MNEAKRLLYMNEKKELVTAMPYAMMAQPMAGPSNPDTFKKEHQNTLTGTRLFFPRSYRVQLFVL